MCWSVWGCHSGGAGPKEMMLKLDQKDGEGNQAIAGMEEENRR